MSKPASGKKQHRSKKRTPHAKSGNDLVSLSAAVGICLLAGIIGSVPTMDAIPGWYAGLNKPAFTPPNWLFGPVWTILYILMGFALYRMRNMDAPVKTRQHLTRVFYLQLILNALWSLVFFGARSPLIAFFTIAVLWYAIAYLILKLQTVERPAAVLLLPYFFWVSFATLLNYSVWQLNL